MVVAHLRDREPALSHRGLDRRAHRGNAARCDRRLGRARGARGVRVEASIAKVAGSEALDYVLDENIQIHGGNGYVRDYPAERHYRDARVNRIFEGTNEINRLLIPGMLIRRAIKGELPLIPAAKALQDELLGPPSMPSTDDGVLADERRAVEAFRKTALMVFGLAMQTYGQKLTDEQEVLMHLADIIIDVFSAESATLRAIAASEQKSPRAALHAGRGARVRQRRGDAHRGVGAPGARRDGRRRHAADDAGGAAAGDEGDANQHRGGAAPAGGCDRRTRRVLFADGPATLRAGEAVEQVGGQVGSSRSGFAHVARALPCEQW